MGFLWLLVVFAVSCVSAAEINNNNSTERLNDLQQLAFDCTGRKDGYYGNPTEVCSNMFFACVGGKSVPMQCAGLTKYDVSINSCQFMRFVVACGGSNPNTTVATTVNTTTITTTIPAHHFECSQMDLGNYPDPDASCSQIFFTCTGGFLGLRRECPGATYYAAELDQCLFRYQVPGCNGTYLRSTSSRPVVVPVSDPIKSESESTTMSNDVILSTASPLSTVSHFHSVKKNLSASGNNQKLESTASVSFLPTTDELLSTTTTASTLSSAIGIDSAIITASTQAAHSDVTQESVTKASVDDSTFTSAILSTRTSLSELLSSTRLVKQTSTDISLGDGSNKSGLSGSLPVIESLASPSDVTLNSTTMPKPESSTTKLLESAAPTQLSTAVELPDRNAGADAETSSLTSTVSGVVLPLAVNNGDRTVVVANDIISTTESTGGEASTALLSGATVSLLDASNNTTAAVGGSNALSSLSSRTTQDVAKEVSAHSVTGNSASATDDLPASESIITAPSTETVVPTTAATTTLLSAVENSASSSAFSSTPMEFEFVTALDSSSSSNVELSNIAHDPHNLSTTAQTGLDGSLDVSRTTSVPLESSTSSSDDVQVKSSSLLEDTTTTEAGIVLVTANSKINCDNGDDVIAPPDDPCPDHFYQCYHGLIYLVHCPGFTRYSAELDACLRPEKIPLCSNI